ncbi:zinc ABC transporter substrate-binding protein [Methanotrichaceae archaeon M04Ac]|uniref:Zinc ABC transporter substrate-binding protein n=1 Tax=Candidatus Methanocrinis alkalitolerans TaxID=3033395 RepID=A0ABT5XBE2_9EURY|nr:zinc ABC transporter substrate-binding protein [Candidatus Methanocrinis alkalitolerans]MDF0592040.1 zinc ABC transporter substrate-binding protein [Candidatus Methanocrinis alkalitolerans]
MNSSRSTALALTLALALLCGCISDEVPADGPGKVKVVVTTVPLATFTKAVGGDLVEVTVLVPPGANLHTFEPAPSKLAKVAKADLYIKNGAGLEIWMDKIIGANRRMLIVDSSSGIDLLEGHHHHEDGGGDGEADHHHGPSLWDLHPSILTADPHIWLSAKNAAIMAENICRGLTEVDPENADAHRENLAAFKRELEDLDLELASTFSGAEGGKFIVLHPAWGYFARDYGLVQVAILEEDKEPGPRQLRTIVDLARKEGVETIYVDPSFNPKSGEIIAAEIGGGVVALDPLAEDYVDNMRKVAREISSGIKSQDGGG